MATTDDSKHEDATMATTDDSKHKVAPMATTDDSKKHKSAPMATTDDSRHEDATMATTADSKDRVAQMATTDYSKYKVAPIEQDIARAIAHQVATPGADSLVPIHNRQDGHLKDNDDYEIVSSIPSVPVTMKRPAFKGKKGLKQPSIPRANIAASAEHPHGTTYDDWASKHSHESVLQQHILFWTRTTPGIIWPHDTFSGFCALGYSLFMCLLAVFVIHSNFSYPTLPPGRTWLTHFIPDLRFPIYVERIHKDKHGSDSNTYDNEGRFVPQHFEEIFEKYATGDKQSISPREIINYMKGQWDITDPIGWGASIFEFLATYIFLWPEDGRMKKEDIRRVYDGSIFFEYERRELERKEKLRREKAITITSRHKEVRVKKTE